MTEKEKMQKQMLYNANYDTELIKERKIAKDLCYEFNQLRPSETKKQEKIIKKLFGKIKERFCITAPFWCDYGYNIEIGKNFYANHNLVILDCAKVVFGDNVFIAPNCGFHTAGHPMDYERRNQGLEYAYPITVGNNVWIGAGVQVMPGVTIGNNVVIGGGSLVNKDIPDNSLAVGNPCRVIREITEEDKRTYFEEDKRPDFKDIKSFEEFKRFYWYREELAQICKSMGLEHRGTKQELNHIIEQFFSGNKIEKTLKHVKSKQTDTITPETPLLDCGFSFNTKFREYFSSLTGVIPFKFTADMATAWRKVKSEKDLKFTINDLLKVYYGKSDYAKYDNSVCQWNQFLKDFCLDEKSKDYTDKLKVASIIWKEVRDSAKEKVYSEELLTLYFDKIKKYHK